MGRFWVNTVLGITVGSFVLAGMVDGQAIQAAVTPPANTSPTSNATNPRSKDGAEAPRPNSIESVQPIEEATETTLDPASLLPDLPALHPAKASLIGGTINKLDRVRDQITVQVFGGGKMRIAFDTRTHIYNNGAPGSTSDLKKGDRIYIDTVLDGSRIFAKAIRLKNTTSAGESQGVVVGYRADKGELELRDLLSPRPLKIHVTSQTKFINGDRTASTSNLVPGTLVAVKFGAQQDGSDIASQVSILAVPGASFTFVGTVTAMDLRLGILVLTSSVDHKTYEVSIDSALIPADDLRPGADVTVLSRFDGRRYVARTVTVNSQN